eukprot:5819231-Lingulodinium_polyedra.AAC.1
MALIRPARSAVPAGRRRGRLAEDGEEGRRVVGPVHCSVAGVGLRFARLGLQPMRAASASPLAAAI